MQQWYTSNLDEPSSSHYRIKNSCMLKSWSVEFEMIFSSFMRSHRKLLRVTIVFFCDVMELTVFYVIVGNGCGACKTLFDPRFDSRLLLPILFWLTFHVIQWAKNWCQSMSIVTTKGTRGCALANVSLLTSDSYRVSDQGTTLHASDIYNALAPIRNSLTKV